jgi:surface protein
MPTTTGKIYLGSTLVASGAAAPAAGWQRPSDWPALPAVAPTDQVFYGLNAVFDHEANFATIRATGAFTVDWGDGSAPVNVASNTTAEYNYSYAATGLGAVTSRGYKTAIVTVTPQAGQTLSNIELGLKHTQSGLVNGHTSAWLDIRLAMNNGGTVSTFVNANWVHRLLEQFEWVGNNAQINFTNFLHSCFSLQSVPLFDTSSVTNFTNFLNGCSSLQSVPLFDTSSGTAFGNFLIGCSSLQSVPLFDTSSGTNFSGFLRNCSSLQSVPLFDASSVTTFANFLQGCSSLQSVPLFDTSSVTNFANFLQGCFSLQSVPLFDASSVTNFASFLTGGVCVSRIQATFPNNQSLSLANLSLGPDALDEIYTNLPTASGSPTITVTGNWGTAAHDPTIATGKGWTVTA